ncbi:MAG: putative zinc-binding metallopeptidase [Deltaproteobacteria bacterium]|nr:MAG: putative zinc-binding metallopeptidase [Deltaproteobacteria bacterium]
MPTEELLEVRLCDLDLGIAGSPLEPRLEELYGELRAAGLGFRPNVWLSTDWFAPEGVPGFAIPFYLAHPRLARLERQQMFQVEGGDRRWCMQLLRHETGHAIDCAHRLHYRRAWREHFGRASAPYRATYVPDPDSRRFVHNLPDFYAQSHPLEDFAETFAVWLRPGARWRTRYVDWPALRKLVYVDALMAELADHRPAVRSRERTDSLPTVRMTLREYYRRKQAHYGREDFSGYDRDLRRLFSDDPSRWRRKSAAAFLRERRSHLRRGVAQWTGQHRYVVDEVLKGMIQRSRELGLRVSGSEREAGEGAAALVTLHATRIARMRHREYFR